MRPILEATFVLVSTGSLDQRDVSPCIICHSPNFKGSSSGGSDAEPSSMTVIKNRPPRRASAARAKLVVKDDYLSDDEEF